MFKTLRLVSLTIALISASALCSERTEYFSKFPLETATETNKDQDLVRVYYFYNLNCPTCKKLSPIMSDWIGKNSKKLDVIYIPITVIKEWEWATKAFLVASEISPSITLDDLVNAQEKVGVGDIVDILRAADVVRAATNADRGTIMAKLASESIQKTVNLMNDSSISFGIVGVPSLVVIGADSAYRVSPEFGLSTQGMLNVTDGILNYEAAIKSGNK